METEPAIDGNQLRRNLLNRIPDRGHRVSGRLVLVAAAASLVAVLVGLETGRWSRGPVVTDDPVVHEAGANVILVLREGNEPIYIATGTSTDRLGE